MKRVLIFLLLIIALHSRAQIRDSYSEKLGTLRLGAGYTHDFPGLNGYSFTGEFSRYISDQWQGAFGVKLMNLSGHPRTTTVNEYTRATKIDFNFYFLPVQSEQHIVRLGLGYAFSFFKTRRSYPLMELHGTESTITWPVQDQQGRTSGISLMGEYEYVLAQSHISFGVRAALYKAYERVSYVGPFVGVRL